MADLDITYFPIFFAHGFRDVRRAGEFLRGCWRCRVAEECVPVWDSEDTVGRDSGVNFEKEYETPARLRTLSGRGSTFQDDLFS
ncbi:hypothetical protein VUR80DRAFT_6141 [Thermomyces stellatus]